jgi:predicted Zn-dependent protease
MDINENAIRQYGIYKTLFPAVSENAFIYQWHNQHMRVNCAILAGRYGDAKKEALLLRENFDAVLLSAPAPMGSAVQYIYATPLFVDVHFGKWDEILQTKPPSSDHVYASLLHHFAKGMAHAGKNNIPEAKISLVQLQHLLQHKELSIPFGAFSSAADGGRVAESMLKGMISMKEKNTEEAISYFAKAVALEEEMVYNEPRDWLLNPKQYLGAAYLVAGNWQEAETVFRNDLKTNAANVWSLFGLEKAYAGQNKTIPAELAAKERKKSGSKSDVEMDRLFF